MKGCFYYFLWALQTYDDILLPVQLSTNLPGIHEPYHIFADYLVEGWLIIYMDDLMVHLVDLEEHISRV